MTALEGTQHAERIAVQGDGLGEAAVARAVGEDQGHSAALYPTRAARHP